MAHTGCGSGPLTAEVILSRHSPLAGQVEAMRRVVRKRRLSWGQLDAFLHLRAELQEIDTRWSQLGPKGIFNRIEANCPSALGHVVPGVDRMEDAMISPPRDTRAAVRGAQVKEFSGRQQGSIHCSWEHICDLGRHLVLNMADDPFATTARWESAAEDSESGRLLDTSIEDDTVTRHFERLHHLSDLRRRQAEAVEGLTVPIQGG